MGPLYIKLGQIWGNSGVYLSADQVADLRRLQNKVPFQDHEICESVSRIKERGLVIGPVIASGSIAIVFHCTLPDGAPGVAKIRRAGIHNRVTQNIISFDRFLHYTSFISDRILGSTVVQDVHDVFNMNRTQMLEQTDFRKEIKNMIMFKKKIKIENIHIPHVYESLSDDDCIVMEQCRGIQPSSACRQPESAKTLLEFLLECPAHGFCHGDLHLGNLLVDGNTLNILDFGLVFHLKRHDIDDFYKFVSSICMKDVDSAFDMCAKSFVREPTKLLMRETEFKTDLSDIIDFVTDADLCKLETLFERSSQLFIKYGTRTLPAMANLQLAFVACEGTVYELDPKCDVWHICKGILMQQHMKRLVACQQ